MEATIKTVNTVNADGLILGRMASKIAKSLLNGEEITIVNAEKAVLSGRKASRVAEAKQFLEVGGVGHGPFHYRRPDRIVRKTIRGMLPFKQHKGRQAYKRLRVFIGIPDELKNHELKSIAEAHAEKLKCPYFTVGDLAKEIGWSQGE